jgi:predicted lipoprotein with Yx(FWY)xxD motif
MTHMRATLSLPIGLPLSLVLASLVLVSLVLAGCGTGAASTPTASKATATATATPAPVVLVKVKTATVGRKRMQVLGNLKSMTLYYFKPDTSANVTCTASCAQLWPPLLAPTGTPAASSNLPGTLNAVTGADGRQVIYNGHPLYTYSKDHDAGDAYGQGIEGQWFVATPGLSMQP